MLERKLIMDKNACYLGDGAYAIMLDGGQVRLMTYNGVEITNSIYMDGNVYSALLDWVEKERARRFQK
jgi:exopolysaccharide biosynthesis protein